MKLTIYTYLFSLLSLCTPALFGAASSSSMPPEQYVQIQPEPIPSLQELSLRTIAKDITTKRPITTSQAPMSSSYVQRKSINLQTLLMQARKLAEDFLGKPIANAVPARNEVTTIQTAEDLHAFIASVISPEQLEILSNKGVYEIVFDRLVNILAKDYFLKLSAKKEGRKPELLPEWLHEHFTGVSIQDLLDYNDIDLTDKQIYVNNPPFDQYFWLNDMYINDLTGLNNTVATSHQLHSLRFQSNLITTVKSNTFAKFKSINEINLGDNNITIIEPHAFDILHLYRLYLYNNPIAQNPEERARIEKEVRTATKGLGRVFWDAP